MSSLSSSESSSSAKVSSLAEAGCLDQPDSLFLYYYVRERPAGGSEDDWVTTEEGSYELIRKSQQIRLPDGGYNPDYFQWHDSHLRPIDSVEREVEWICQFAPGSPTSWLGKYRAITTPPQAHQLILWHEDTSIRENDRWQEPYSTVPLLLRLWLTYPSRDYPCWVSQTVGEDPERQEIWTHVSW